MLRQVLRLCTVQLRRKVRGYSGHPVNLIGGVQGGLVAREHNQDAASSSQLWQKDAILDESTRRLAAAEKHQELLNFHENLKSTRKPVASGNSNSEGTDKIWPHNLQTSTAYIPHLEKFSRTPRDIVSVRETKCNISQCECGYVGNIYVRSSISAVHLWKDYSENVRSTRNQPMKSLKQLIQVSNWETDQGSDRKLRKFP